MTEIIAPSEQKIIVIPAKSGEETQRTSRLKVAAYCRVSTDQEEQESSYEAQISYYTDKIGKNPNGKWREFSRTRVSLVRKQKNAPNSSR